jgi:lysophospholipase
MGLTVLAYLQVPGLDVTSFVDGSLPLIGMAHSGGGYRAMLNGAGVFAGIDERTPGSINGNQTSTSAWRLDR